MATLSVQLDLYVFKLKAYKTRRPVAHILDRGLICHRACREVEAMDTMEAKIIKFIQIAYLDDDRIEPLDVSSVMKQSEKLVHSVHPICTLLMLHGST